MMSIGISIFGAFLWGFMADCKGFSFTFLTVVLFDMVVKLVGVFAYDKTSILIMFVLIGINSKSMTTIVGPGFVEIFGLDVGT